MRILLTNDDGIFAPGLSAMYKYLVKFGEVMVVAPSDTQSGTGHSITYTRPVTYNKVDINGLFTGYSVQGSPADCVKLAVMQLADEPIDLVIAGVNAGANTGINVYYSGTVAAAMEAAFLKIPSVAMSLAIEDKVDFEKAAQYCVGILEKLLPLNAGDVINVNIPPLSKGRPKGIRVVPQSIEGFDEYYIRQTDEQGRAVFQLAFGNHRAEVPPADTASVIEGFITITALTFDMTNHEKTNQLRQINFADTFTA